MQHPEIEIISVLRKHASMQIRRGTNSQHYRKGTGKQYWLEVPAVRMIMILKMMTTIATWEIVSIPRVMKMSVVIHMAMGVMMVRIGEDSNDLQSCIKVKF